MSFLVPCVTGPGGVAMTNAPAITNTASRRLSTALPLAVAALTVAAGAFAAVLLAQATCAPRLHQLDAAARAFAHAAGPEWTSWWRAVTLVGTSYVFWPLVLATAVAFRLADRNRDALLLAEATLGGFVIEHILKLAVHRARPPALWGDAAPLTYSFPSGHALLTTCFALTLAWILARGRGRARAVGVWAAALLVPLLVGWSRVELGVHFATDVLGGLAIALLWLAALRWARRRAASAQRPGTV